MLRGHPKAEIRLKQEGIWDVLIIRRIRQVPDHCGHQRSKRQCGPVAAHDRKRDDREREGGHNPRV